MQQWQPAQGFILFPDTNLMTATLKKVTDVGSIVGRAQFLEESLIIIEGVEKEQLEQGLAHNPLSLLPGRKGNCLIYGHREQFLWSLKDLKVGEPIIIESVEGIFYYAVDEISIRLPNEPYIFESTEESVLTLVTCYPFVYYGLNKERYVVKATLN